MTITPKFIANDEDGPVAGVLYDLPNGDQVWSGEVSAALFDRQSPEAQAELGGAFGDFVVLAERGGEVMILARAAGPEIAMELATLYAHSRLAKAA